MPNENLNNDSHLRSKLEELESLPGEAFNKEASWEKLYSRLKKKSVNRKALWYWAAAACLLLSILTPWFLANKKEEVLAGKKQIQNKTGTPALPAIQANNKDSLVIISSITTENKMPVSQIETRNKIASSVNHKIFAIETAAIKNDKKEIIEPEIINNVITPLDTQVSIVNLVPEKKKLRVIHINELGDPVQEPPVMARRTEFHSFQIKFPNQEVFVNTPGNSGSTGFTILTIKNSPN